VILGFGVDLCEVERMERELGKEGAGFRDEVFTAAEIAYCEGKRYPAQHFAARFAAKEAVSKALAAAGISGAAWRGVEVAKTARGGPVVVLHGDVKLQAQERGIDEVLISLSHTDKLAMACAVVGARSPEIEDGEE